MRFKVKAGTGFITASPLLESSHLCSEPGGEQLRERFKQDGYIFLKGRLPPELVLQAYNTLLRRLHKSRPDSISLEGKCLSSHGVGLLSRQELAHHPDVLAVLNCSQLISLAALLFEESKVKTTTFKWLRAVAPGDFTGLHTDRVFLGSNSERLLTIWIPFDLIRPELGSLLICRGSHRSRGFSQLRQSYGASQVGADGTKSGWLTDDGSRLRGIMQASPGWIDWRTACLEPGDVVVLHQDCLHMTASNETDRFRISCDTRWQPQADKANPKLGTWTEFAAI